MTGPHNTLIGTPVLDRSGQALGTVSALLVDPQSLQGRWLQIELADQAPVRSAVIPLASASQNPTGAMVTPWTADTVARAPEVGAQITAEQTRALNSYDHLDL